MDTRIRMQEVINFIKVLHTDYQVSTKEMQILKKKAILKTIKMTCSQIWSGVTAPLVYPFWWLFREKIVDRVYRGTSWQEILELVRANKTVEVESKLKQNGRFWFWLWTFGDLEDPLGRGELPKAKENNFKTRFYENAIRNPRFTINYMFYRSGTIVAVEKVIDTRDFTVQHASDGLGSAASGCLFKWMLDDRGDWLFIYDDNNQYNLFYYGYSGLGRDDIGHNGRFEIGYRKN